MSEHPSHEIDSPAGNEAPRQALAGILSRRLRMSRVHESLFGVRLETVKIGRFTLLERIGAGSMGEIYAAYDERLDRKVAIKLLHEGLDTSSAARRRLVREAQTLARLSHPNVVHAYEAGAFDDRVFIAMEFVPGRTLREWLHMAAPPGQRPAIAEILRHFIAAGRGLEAAHRAGLVHRDFKPGNVLIGDDGRARVVDFGLARTDVAQAPEPGAADMHEPAGKAAGLRPLRAAVTQTTVGRLMGTPGYMSPEQLHGKEADHRSDQFSFCVALFEALHGERPFPGETLDELRESVQNGVIREPSRLTRVPAAMHKALLRGLETDPNRRFADMGALLAALETFTSSGRPRAWLVGFMIIPVLVAAVLWRAGSSAPQPCSLAGSAMDGVWNYGRRDLVARVFAAAGMSATGQRVQEEIEKYGRAWRTISEDACRATHVQGTRSELDLSHSTTCLERGRMRLDALLGDIGRNDAAALASASIALAELYPPDTCTDPEYLAHPIEPPPPPLAAGVEQVRAQLAGAHGRRVLGYYADAADRAEAALAEAQRLGYTPLVIEAEHERGASLMLRGKPGDVEEAGKMLEDAALGASAARHDQIAVEIWHDRVLGAILHDATTEAGHDWAKQADAAIMRVGDPPRLRAMHLRHLGLLALADENYKEAVSFHEQALAIAEQESDYPDVRRALHFLDLGTALRRAGRPDEAEARYKQAIDALGSDTGISSPRVAEIHFERAMLAVEQGKLAVERGQLAMGREQLDNALASLREIIEVHERALGPTHNLVGKAHLEIAEILRFKAETSGSAGDLGEAIGHLQRGYVIYAGIYGPEHPRLADIANLTGAIAYTASCPAEALQCYETALRTQQAIWDKDPARIDIGYTWANIAEARIALGDLEGAGAALDEAQKTRALPEIKEFIKGLRTRLTAGPTAPAPCKITLPILKTHQ